MKAKYLFAALTAVAIIVAVRLKPRKELDAYLDYEEWPLFQ